MPTEDVAPSGWYGDPVAGNFERYWDGVAWTDRLRPQRSGGSGGAAEDSDTGSEVAESEEKHPPAAESATTLLAELRKGRLLLACLAVVAVAQLAVAGAVLVYLAIDPSEDRGWVAALCGGGALVAITLAALLMRRSIR